MQVSLTDIDNLNKQLTIQIAKEDYSDKLKQELNKYRKDASFKGFRKGKTPMGFIRKMYGTALLTEVVQNEVQQKLSKYIIDEKVKILGQPLPAESQEPIDFNIKEMGDYEYKFDIGVAPTFEIKGLDHGSNFEYLKVEIPESMVMEELDSVARKLGTPESQEADIEEKDVLMLDCEELDEDKIKEGGWTCSFPVMVDLIINEDLKKEVLSKKKGDQIQFDIYDLEKDRDAEYVKKYFLNQQEDDETEIGSRFEGTIKEVTRIKPAAFDQEFFDKAFGEGIVSSLEEAKDKTMENIQAHFDRQADAIVFRNFQEVILEKNPLELPDAFLKRWLKASDDSLTEDKIEGDFEAFAKNIQWSLLQNKIAEDFNLDVTEDELKEGFKRRILRYMGGYYSDEQFLASAIDRLMTDNKQVEQLFDELMADKLFFKIKEQVSLTNKAISIDDFKEKVEELNKEQGKS